MPAIEKTTCCAPMAGTICSRVCCRRDGERGDGAAVGDGEEHPAVEESDEVSVGFAQVNVLAAGVGKHRAEFGEREAGEQRNDAAKHPDQQEQHGMRQRAGDVFGGKENRRADDAADQQQN